MSDTVTFTAASGPLLVALIVYCMVSPILARVALAIFVMERSATSDPGGTTSVSSGGVVLSSGLSSGVSEVTFAMLDMVVPFWTSPFTVTKTVIVSNA